MKNKIFSLLYLLLLTLPVKVQAEQAFKNSLPLPQEFSLRYEPDNFPIGPQTLDSWRQNTAWPARSNLLRPALSTKNELGTKILLPRKKPEILMQYSPYSRQRVYNFVKNLSQTMNTAASEPKLTIENDKATEFVAPKDGAEVDIFKTTQEALAALANFATSSQITVNTSSPSRSLAQTNSLGIRELLAQGKSSFAGSPKNRRHNIKVGVGKFKGLIIPPGEEFSFNKFLGPVEGDQGFLPELVIKKSGTVPELGGGLCQVSSTTFRAAAQAGLPILERKNHSYAVQYYAPQGTDATIYPGVIDLKFTNDTPGHLLIWPHFEDKDQLIFDFYGTRDDRQVEVQKPVVFDRKTDGPMKASWTRTVLKNGEASSSTFKSIYLSPALFHKEETFPTAPTSTTTTLTPAPQTN